MADGTSNRGELCPSCGWPVSRHLAPCPPVLPLDGEIVRGPVPGVDITTGKGWPSA